MTGEPQKAFKEDRNDTWRSVGISLLIGAIGALAVIGTLTLTHVDQLVGNISRAQTYHTATLRGISANQAIGHAELKAIQKQDSDLTGAVANVTQAFTEIQTEGAAIIANQQAICSLFPNCHLPSPTI